MEKSLLGCRSASGETPIGATWVPCSPVSARQAGRPTPPRFVMPQGPARSGAGTRRSPNGRLPRDRPTTPYSSARPSSGSWRPNGNGATSPPRLIYRGYAPSTGRPSAAAILQDSLLIHDHVVATLSPDRIVAVGLSIGTGPAAYLANQRPIAGLILITPFDSLRALAHEHYPWAPVGLLLRHEMEIADTLAASSAPVALIAAERDTIVPPHRTEPVRRSAGNMVLDRVIADAGHNDLYDRAEFERAMREALSLIEG